MPVTTTPHFTLANDDQQCSVRCTFLLEERPSLHMIFNVIAND
jgi:hypothetical protein